jgi:hypothetical protein
MNLRQRARTGAPKRRDIQKINSTVKNTANRAGGRRMTLLDTVIGKVVGLFVDDDFLACSRLVVVGITAMVLRGTPMDAIAAAAVLAGGCLAVLVVGVLRTARSRESR